MKGTVVATWMKTCRKLFEDSVVDSAMKSVGWNSHKNFHHQKILMMVRLIA